MKERCMAVVLAAGKGKRMQAAVHKQYLMIREYPVLYYSLKCFEDCPWIDGIILVTGEGEIGYCRKEIVERYGFRKVTAIVTGGKERYHSVYQGLQACGSCDYVFIHDGARPFVDGEILERGLETVRQCGACAAGMPVKDTVKIVDEEGFVIQTPDRSRVWNVQTPQIFRFPLVLEAYQKALAGDCSKITDDAMVVERYGNHPIKLYEGSYYNIKITTPEDLVIADNFFDEKNGKK